MCSFKVEILFYTFPLSFIAGNLILSIHLVIFIIFSLLLIKKEKMPFRIGIAHLLIIAFFLYIFFSTAIQFQINDFLNERTKDWPLQNHPTFKAFILLRYLILIFRWLSFHTILLVVQKFCICLFCLVKFLSY